MKQKLRKDSFAAKLTPAQRDELFTKLAGGLGHDEGAALVGEWTKAEGWRKPVPQAVSAWFVGERIRRKHLVAAEAMIVTQANCPADMDAQTRLALGQAKYLAVIDDLSPKEIAILEKNDISKDKLALDKTKVAQDNRVARRDLRLDRDALIFERIRGGEKSQDLNQQIALALEEINKIKHGEDGP